MKKILLVLGVITVLIAVHLTVVHLVHSEIYQRDVIFVDPSSDAVMEELEQNRRDGIKALDRIEKTTPFEEIFPFDEDALCWSNLFSQYAGAGVLVFDANGDDRLDVYFCQDGQNWTRPTGENGVLQKEPRYQSNGLYLNQGNDENGYPRFKQIGRMAAESDAEAEAELLVEGYLFPRRSPSDTTKRWGRSSNVAAAADFNNDGRLDLLVGNEPKGMVWSDPQTQSILMPFVSPVGRQAKYTRQPLAGLGLHLIEYQPTDGTHAMRESQRGNEPEGANSLYLNLGDSDGDGIPEWLDVSLEAGIMGSRATQSFTVADVDLDGDLDIFEGNFSDLDYWTGGSKFISGGVNCLYINQLAETGKLTFIERAQEMDIDGVYDEDYPMPDYYRLKKLPFLAEEYSILLNNYEAYKPEFLTIDGVQSEHAQLTWTSVFQDVNDDGYPDLWVGNDLGFLRLYINREGKRFERRKHARSEASGFWMSTAPGDFNGDLKEDLFAGNGGGGIMNHGFVLPNPYDMFEPEMINAAAVSQFMLNKHDTRHALIDGADLGTELANRVFHSVILPPDISFPNNVRHLPKDLEKSTFDPDTINAYEFSWGSVVLDVQNDARDDIYYVGCAFGRGGGIFPITGTGPGRLLVNITQPGAMTEFIDLTAEHHVFNIHEMNYDELETKGYISRRSPSQNWGKRDVVYSYDRSTWISQGRIIQEKITNQDMIQTSENGRGLIAADLNGDGFRDIIVRNHGGYDSRSSKAVYLKANFDGKPQILPPPDNNYPALTHFEPGSTRVFLNRYTKNHWIKIRLISDDDGSLNRDAIGAVLVANGTQMKVKRATQGSFISNRMEAVLFGLGRESLTSLKIIWPDRERSETNLRLDHLHNQTLTISKTRGLLREGT